VVRDTMWNKMVINKAIASHRDIIPVHFSGENSSFFYKFARLRKRLGIRFNLEMVHLPREMLLNEGARFVVTLGEPVAWQSLSGGTSAIREAAALRDIVYSLQAK
ncbi:MAG: glycerol acyltransferase, partial [Duncaniella sp.]|nr:glycerol acyltransferase [Duncaniella sp.]